MLIKKPYSACVRLSLRIQRFLFRLKSYHIVCNKSICRQALKILFVENYKNRVIFSTFEIARLQICDFLENKACVNIKGKSADNCKDNKILV